MNPTFSAQVERARAREMHIGLFDHLLNWKEADYDVIIHTLQFQLGFSFYHRRTGMHVGTSHTVYASGKYNVRALWQECYKTICDRHLVWRATLSFRRMCEDIAWMVVEMTMPEQ